MHTTKFEQPNRLVRQYQYVNIAFRSRFATGIGAKNPSLLDRLGLEVLGYLLGYCLGAHVVLFCLFDGKDTKKPDTLQEYREIFYKRPEPTQIACTGGEAPVRSHALLRDDPDFLILMMIILYQSLLHQDRQNVGSRLAVTLLIAAIVLFIGHGVVAK